MDELRAKASKYAFAAFITLVGVAIVYYLLQEIPHAQHPTLHPVRTITPGAPASP